ncbi:MAG: CHAT domain-containing protein [Desulfobacterales bacterium]|nr:CHAT domain-containing protein [Desulfobacterales bacterium]
MTSICEHIGNIEKYIEKKDTAKLANSIIDLEKAFLKSKFGLCQRGIKNKAGSVEEIIKARKDGVYKKQMEETTKNWIADYEKKKDKMNHKERKHKLEEIIRLIKPIVKDNYPESYIILAKAYLYRGIIFRPKGFRVPARKIEALKEAEKFSKKACYLLPNNIDALRVWAYSVLEIEFIFKESIKLDNDLFNKAAQCIANDRICDLKDMAVILRYSEKEKNQTYLYKILNENNDYKRAYDLLLYKAKACFLLNKADEIKSYIERAIEQAPKAFSDPFWDDIVEFLLKLKENDSKLGEIWKNLSLKTIEACMNNELKISSGINLIRHWARQKPLYDLAFLAASTPVKKVEIADSLKSRPALRYAVLNNLKNEISEVDEILKIEDESRDGRYIKKEIDLDAKKIADEIKSKNISPEELTEPWIAVHFYLNEIDGNGYAINFDSKTKKWEIHSFKYKELYESFKAWYVPYSHKDEDDEFLSEMILTLCKKIGETMPFLHSFPINSNILWIPHGFLHHLPLHAAILNNGKILFETCLSRYLPAWHLGNFSEKQAVNGKGRFLLKRFGNYHFEEICDLDWDKKEIEEATKEMLINYLKTNPEILMLLCHGEADILNPFRSKLKLKEPGCSILDILKSTNSNIRSTKVFLGACESDMAQFSGNTIDEHLSLSSVLLSIGCNEIIAGLWEVHPYQVEECYKDIIPIQSSVKQEIDYTLKEWQIKAYREGIRIYRIAPFRIMGLPSKKSSNNEVQS